MKKQVVNLTVFLFKDYISDFDDCLKSPQNLSSSALKPDCGIDGKIYYCNSNSKPPKWKSYLDELSKDSINLSDNTSNKAILLIRIKERIMAIVFGYGRAFIKEECIVRNFGLKVALNIINQQKMRSVNAATIEDMVVNTQRQASYSTSQDEFGLNITNDIMKGITGEPYDDVYGSHISGKDSLVVAVFMDMTELTEKLDLYLEAFTSDRYKKIGFDWVDNVAEVRDSILSEALDFTLTEAISKHNTNHLHVSPPETTDWDNVIGFCYSGIKKSTSKTENYTLALDLTEYIESIKPDTNVYQKLRRDKLYGLTADGIPFVISSIYSSLVFQTEYKSKHYILCSGTWYLVDDTFFNQVNDYIRTKIRISDVSLPNCDKAENEEEYNKRISNNDPNFCLMDRKMTSVLGGPKKIEACDLFTKNKQFIHVKNKGQSAQLSHLFAQGKVSAECFISDESFRKQVSERASEEFGSEVFDYKKKPASNEFEIIYAIIDDKDTDLETKLPFFSKVNLMLTAQELDRMHFPCSICLVKKE